MTEPNDFFGRLLPYAQEVRNATGMPVSVTLAQWAHESGFEGSNWVGGNNYSGITAGGPPNFLKFGSLEEFTQKHIATLKESPYWGVRSVARQVGTPAIVAEALGRSPWSGDHYADPEQGTPGGLLIKVIKENDLIRYDQAPPVKPGTSYEPPASGQKWWLPSSVGDFYANLNSTVLSGAWWKRSGQLLLVLLLGVIFLVIAANKLTGGALKAAAGSGGE